MRGARGAALLAGIAIVVGAVGCKKEVAGLGINLDIQSKNLSNGLRVLMVVDRQTPVVSYQSWYRVGSVDERPGVTGITHFFEHLFFKGTAKFPGRAYFKELEAHGAEVNAVSARDYTVFYQTLTPDLLPKLVEMEADRMQNLSFTEEVRKRESLVALEERRLRVESSPVGKIHEALWATAFRFHPYRSPVMGWPEDIVAITTEQIQEWYRTYFVPSNCTVVVAGNFDPDQVWELIKKNYGTIPERPRPVRKIGSEPEQNEERRLRLREKVGHEQFAQAYRITSATDSDSYAIDVLSNILFEGNDSRAHRRLVEELEIALSIAGTSFTPTYPGLLTVTGVLRSGRKTEEAEKELDRLIREIEEKGVTQAEVQKAVKQLLLQLVDGVRTAHGMAQLLGTVTSIVGDPDQFAEGLEKYSKLTPADIQRVASKYLVPNQRSIVILSDGATP